MFALYYVVILLIFLCQLKACSLFREQELYNSHICGKQPEESPTSTVIKLEYFSQLSVTSVAEVAWNHITVIGYACMRYIREFAK